MHDLLLVGDVDRSGDETRIGLGKEPVSVPEPFAAQLNYHTSITGQTCAQQPEMVTCHGFSRASPLASISIRSRSCFDSGN
ncbi:Uncharacterised protein [Mycobacteroides abscessus]|nr:Uncharacterised protein [Mycobacteroides abscessus]CPZ76427.1 Uncharacterised protein [Mycobacteroides abscessus]